MMCVTTLREIKERLDRMSHLISVLIDSIERDSIKETQKAYGDILEAAYNSDAWDLEENVSARVSGIMGVIMAEASDVRE